MSKGIMLWGKIKHAFLSFSKFMQNLVNFVLLSIVYFAGIGPVSLIMKLFRTKFLEMGKSKRKSNWSEHKLSKQPIESYFRTF